MEASRIKWQQEYIVSGGGSDQDQRRRALITQQMLLLYAVNYMVHEAVLVSAVDSTSNHRWTVRSEKSLNPLMSDWRRSLAASGCHGKWISLIQHFSYKCTFQKRNKQQAWWKIRPCFYMRLVSGGSQTETHMCTNTHTYNYSALCRVDRTSLESQAFKVGLFAPSLGALVSGGCCTFIRGENCQEHSWQMTLAPRNVHPAVTCFLFWEHRSD